MTSQSQKLARPLRVAVSSGTGRLVDSHFGKADVFQIYEVDANESRLIESREVEEVDSGKGGPSRSAQRIEVIADCDAVVTTRLGEHAQDQLDARGIVAVEYPYLIEQGLRCALQEWQKREAAKPAK